MKNLVLYVLFVLVLTLPVILTYGPKFLSDIRMEIWKRYFKKKYGLDVMQEDGDTFYSEILGYFRARGGYIIFYEKQDNFWENYEETMRVSEKNFGEILLEMRKESIDLELKKVSEFVNFMERFREKTNELQNSLRNNLKK